ncbi:hypothetical protein JQC67_00200 [Aurantibacter crassamenti]|uniref:hypothetical protein n=1 Tax=Aurantibacter crassamenti TaxID=1837375 RepID=UPI00193A9B89|nr:hypothetical protein [Aurantibacter crassamenti]MBM1104545.1 hypothetical protein [Aurantibacter crassamenti]
MKSFLFTTLVIITLSFQTLNAQEALPENNTAFSHWLKKHIPDTYQNATFDHHNDWLQVHIPDQKLTISWGKVTSTQTVLKDVEGLTENESIFIGKKSKEAWTELPNVKYYPGIGYYISKYKSATMGSFKVRPLTIIQFSGKSKRFVNQMVSALTKNPTKNEDEYMYWLKEYIHTEYPNLTVDYHGAWYQSVIPTLELTVTWGTMDKSKMPIKDLHGVREDKSFFIEKATDEGWQSDANIHHTAGVGYYISKYDAASMGNFEVGDICVIQFNGDAKAFVDSMTKAWQSLNLSTQGITEPAAGIGYSPYPENVVVTKVQHFDNSCWKIAAAGGTWYFENGETNGKSGFNSAFDQAGNDWIGNDADKGYNKSSSKGGKHEYRGWPNFGEGNFNHPQRESNSTSHWVNEEGTPITFTDKLEGDHLIMRTSNDTYELEYHFYPTHAAIKVLKADDKYAFLFEGPIGGEQEASVEKDYYVLKDGIHREVKAGGLGYLEPEFGNKFPSPFFYLADSDPKDTQVFYAAVKNVGPETAGDEGWRQGDNMVIFSFGRDEDKRAYTGTEAISVFGFYEKTEHEKISKFIESKLENPFQSAKKEN